VADYAVLMKSRNIVILDHKRSGNKTKLSHRENIKHSNKNRHDMTRGDPNINGRPVDTFPPTGLDKKRQNKEKIRK
jgi:hypothetical protein